MELSELLSALERLGEIAPPGTVIVLAGGAALILGGYIERGTNDGDVVFSRPALARLNALIAIVADERHLPTRWLNDGVKAWADVLPPDHQTRLEDVGTFGNLRVQRLGRRDLLVMKFFALRDDDLEDIEQMAPSEEEIAFVRSQMDRIARLRPAKVLKMQLYLEQGEGVHRRPESGGSDETLHGDRGGEG